MRLSRPAATLSTALREPFRVSTILPGFPESGGIPEVPSGNKSPSRSPPLAATAVTKHSNSQNAHRRRGGAAFTITEECERLFCETLKAVFLGEGNLALQDSLAMGMHDDNNGIRTNRRKHQYGVLATPPKGDAGFLEDPGVVEKWIEVWDYVGGVRFRGFLASNEDHRSAFIFFDDNILSHDLKPGLMALLELCSVPAFDCSQLIACLDRRLPTTDMTGLQRDLGWVGFELATLAVWTDSDDIVSNRWLFLGMDT